MLAIHPITVPLLERSFMSRLAGLQTGLESCSGCAEIHVTAFRPSISRQILAGLLESYFEAMP
jgi:hypothetical protein